jgi:hypothetical protein
MSNPYIQLTMNATDWDEIFYMKPANDPSTIDWSNFTSESFNYKTNQSNIPDIFTDTTSSTKYVSAGDSVNVVVEKQKDPQNLSAVVIRKWAYDVFKLPNMSALFQNLSAINNDLLEKLYQTSSTDLLGQLETKISNADSLTNSTTTVDNIVRELLIIMSNTDPLDARLSTATGSFFHSSNKITASGDYQNYYKFFFSSGDTMIFTLVLEYTGDDLNITNNEPGNVSIDIKIVMT